MREGRRPPLLAMEDKYTGQTYAESLGMLTIPILAVLQRSEVIPWDTLPSRCVIKTNHWSGAVWINNNGIDMTSGGGGVKAGSRTFSRAATRRQIMPQHWDSQESW